MGRWGEAHWGDWSRRFLRETKYFVSLKKLKLNFYTWFINDFTLAIVLDMKRVRISPEALTSQKRVKALPQDTRPRWSIVDMRFLGDGTIDV